MQVEIDTQSLKALMTLYPTEYIKDTLGQYLGNSRLHKIQAVNLTNEQIDTLIFSLKSGKNAAEKKAHKTLVSYRSLNTNPGEVGITSLDGLLQGLQNYIGSSEHKWVYREHIGSLLPFYVQSVKKMQPRDNPERVSMILQYVHRHKQEQDTIHWERKDFKGKPTVTQILSQRGIYLESKELNDSYEDMMKWYHTIQDGTGDQFTASGSAINVTSQSLWRSYDIQMTRDGRDSRVVMDDNYEEESSTRSGDEIIASKAFYSDDSFWISDLQKKAAQRGEEVDEEDDEAVGVAQLLPRHPFVKVFDLEKHGFVEINAVNLEPYMYDKQLADKLILPQEHKNLVDMLLDGEKSLMEDIVSGKTGGIIILATGAPGTGKTLTAQVYAEKLERSLYIVQCAQLGTNEEQLEKKLARVLSRASRWKSILLIDEADVYIRERGTDIQQNAIVGVFLRLLETYAGVMFLTSNRADVIDDAIISRRTAHIQYKLPNRDERVRIWKVLLEQYQIPIKVLADVVDVHLSVRLAETFKAVSGRDVKNLCKLVKFLTDRRNIEADESTFLSIAGYLNIDPERISAPMQEATENNKPTYEPKRIQRASPSTRNLMDNL